jgi:hypothetical protein
MTVRSVFIVAPDKKLKLMMIYPASTGRNFDEIIRVVDSLQLAVSHSVATPVNWKDGDDCMVRMRWPGVLRAARRLYCIAACFAPRCACAVHTTALCALCATNCTYFSRCPFSHRPVFMCLLVAPRGFDM